MEKLAAPVVGELAGAVEDEDEDEEAEPDGEAALAGPAIPP